MPMIKTPEDWWSALNTHLENIGRTIELVYVHPEKFISAKVTLAEAIAKKDHALALEVLNNAWAEAPDRPYIHSWPSWGVLCDLCSECWVFDEQTSLG